MSDYHYARAAQLITERDAAWDAHDEAVKYGKPDRHGPEQGPEPLPCGKCGRPWWVHKGKAHKGSGGPDCDQYSTNTPYLLALEALNVREESTAAALRRAAREERARTRTPRAEGTYGVSPSDAGRCPKSIEYRERPTPDFVPDYSPDGEALAGSLLHEAIERRYERIVPWRHYEMKIDIPGLDTRNSRPDYYDPLLAEIGDYKSAGRGKWDMIGKDGPPRSDLEQANIYAYAVESGGRPVRIVRLIYINRENGEIEEFTRPYDRHMALEALDRLTGIATTLKLGLPLERDPERVGPTNDPICKRCLAYETEVITDRGVKRIGDIVGERVYVLDGNGGWVEAEAKAFGVQTLMRLTVQRRGITKVIYATPDHGWFAVSRRPPMLCCPECGATDGKNGPFVSTRAIRQHIARKHTGTGWFLPERTRTRIETQNLRPGDWLSAVRAKSTPRHGQNPIIPAPIGIQHGFVYGDGYRAARRNGGSYAIFQGAKDAALLNRWFPNHTPRTRADGAQQVAHLPRFFKAAPPIDESSSYLYGFLAGYFAADGCVDKAGHASMSSASRGSLDLVRDIAFRLGIGVGPIRTVMRVGISGKRAVAEATALHTISLDSRTLTAEFFLIDEHRARWQSNCMEEKADIVEGRWQVVSVEMTDRLEETYCFEVPTTHSFVLADNLLTSNCFARSNCWSIPQAERAGRSPESYTHLGAEPEDPTVEATLRHVLDLQTDAREAKKAADNAAVLLEGIPQREYGALRLDPPAGGGLPNWKAYAEILEENYSLSDGQRAPLDRIVVPRTRESTKPRVSLVRAATRERRVKTKPPAAQPTPTAPQEGQVQ